MVRNGKTATDGGPVHRPADTLRGDGGDPVERGILAANSFIGHALNAAQAAVDWHARLHRQHTKVLGEWSHALGAAVTEAEQAADATGLMRAVTRLNEQQLGLAMQQLAEGTALWTDLWMDNEIQWAHRWREDAAAWASRLMPQGTPWALPALSGRAAPGAAGASDGGDDSPLAQLGHFQDQWLALTQRWIQAAGNASKASAR